MIFKTTEKWYVFIYRVVPSFMIPCHNAFLIFCRKEKKKSE